LPAGEVEGRVVAPASALESDRSVAGCGVVDPGAVVGSTGGARGPVATGGRLGLTATWGPATP
jgi:hypothetical protein